MKLDLHVHTTASPDGMNTPSMVVRAAIARGMDGVAVTDHNTNAAVKKVREAAPDWFTVISGVEYSTDCGHVLVLFCEEFAERLERDERGRFNIEALHEFVQVRGGLLVAAHPFIGRESLPEALLCAVNGLESVNSRALSRDETSRARAESAAIERGLFNTGGSDAHLPMEIGLAYTELESGAEPYAAIKNGMCTAQGRRGLVVYRALSRGWRKCRARGKGGKR